MSGGSGHLALLVPALLLVGLCPATARGSDEGDALFQQGRAELRAGRYEAALDLFARSQQIDRAVGTLLNMAVCEEQLQRLTRARQHLGEALADTRADDKRRPLIEGRMAELDRRIPRVTIKARGARAAGVAVQLDGRELRDSELDAPIAIDPGMHRLDCVGPRAERCAGAGAFTFAEGQQLVEIAEVAAPARAGGPATLELLAPTIAAERSAPSSPRAGAAALLAAVGLVALATGMAAGAGVLREKGIVGSHCDDTGCDPDGLSAADTGKTLSLVATVATGAGIAALGTGAYLWLTARPDER